MFVHRNGVAAATLGVLALGACGDPELNTDLRPAGPPDVLAVLVMADAVSQLSELATFCKPGDELRPSLVGLPDFTTQQVCPDTVSETVEPVTNAYPDGWYVRIMFDELLDTSIETLTEITDEDGAGTGTFSGSIRDANPVTLQCRSVTNNELVTVDYDGYYSPSGNRITWPLGPSLVIKPNDPTLVATGKECQITINESVRDKQGEPVPESQRGPFTFNIAPIQVLAIDPADDPDFETPVTAKYLYYDNAYVQFNTAVTIDSLCPDSIGGADGLCDNESVFSIKDVEHPNEGPGYCDVTEEPCGTIADCDAGAGDTVCGRGYCADAGTSCNTAADCPDPANDSCGTTYAYSYLPYGLTETEFGLGPIAPIQTDRKYTMQFTQGAKLVDRCGAETTLSAADADDLTLARFITDKFDFEGATILTGETASAMKRLQYNFNNVLEGQDGASGTTAIPSVAIPSSAFTITPAPKKLTAACAAGGAGCPTADLTAAELLVISPNFDGQTQVNGHLQINTEYTATLAAGTVVNDFYGVPYTFEEDLVIKWKTQPSIAMTGVTIRNTGALVGVGNNGTLVKDDPTNTADIRLAFNASMDPTTLDLTDVKVEPAVADLAIASASGCGVFGSNTTGHVGACTLRLRGTFAEGVYKITLVAGAKFADIFGTEYTQAADQSITVEVVNPAPVAQCL